MKLTREEFKTIVEEQSEFRDDRKVHFNSIKNAAKKKYNKEFDWTDFRQIILNDKDNEFYYYCGFIRLKGKSRSEDHYKILDLLSAIRGVDVRELYGDDIYVDSFPAEEQKYGSSLEITKEIFTVGNCGNVFKILQVFFPDAKACLLDNHILTLIEGRFYDITGEVKINIECPEYTILDEMDVDDYVNNYSFYSRGPIL